MAHEQENAYRQALRETEAGGAKDSNKETPISETPITTTPVETGSLGRVETEFDKKQKLHEENKALLGNTGWRKVDVNNLPSQGKYNDESMRIKIRAASVEEIKHYSSLDETDLLDVSDHINEILNKCCRIEYSDHIGKAALDLREADKYYVLFCIRDLTMDSHQKFHKLWQRTTCPKCGKKSENEITSHAFSYYKIPKNIEKYYDPTLRKIVINDESFADGPLMITPPSLGLTAAIQKYMQDHAKKQQQSGAPIYFDSKFMMQIQYLLDSPAQVTEENLKNLQKKIGNWSHEKLIAFEYVRDNMDVGVRPQLEIVCRNTKSVEANDEVGCADDYSFTAPVVFRLGWRSVLDISGVVARLFDSNDE